MNDLVTEQIWWHVARTGGIVALVLCGLSVVWGLVMSTRLMSGAATPKWLHAMHRWLGGLAVTFTGLHIAGLVMDSYVSFGPLDILIPFVSGWRPGAVALGVVAMYLLLAVQLSSIWMHKIGRKWWRYIHMSSWLVFWSGLVHGVLAGSDASHPLYIVVTGALTLLITFLTASRMLVSRRSKRRTPIERPARTEVVG